MLDHGRADLVARQLGLLLGEGGPCVDNFATSERCHPSVSLMHEEPTASNDCRVFIFRFDTQCVVHARWPCQREASDSNHLKPGSAVRKMYRGTSVLVGNPVKVFFGEQDL